MEYDFSRLFQAFYSVERSPAAEILYPGLIGSVRHENNMEIKSNINFW
jgi:hypothetical protein